MNFLKTLDTDNHLIQRTQTLWTFLLLFALSFAFYGSTIQNDYNLDDNYAYTDNKNATNGLSNIKAIFSENTFSQSTYNYGYRPITTLSFAIENEVFGINSVASHTINILLYFLGCALLFSVLRALFPNAKFGITLACVLLFLALPIHSEIVNNVKSRDELLMLIFGLLSTLLFLKSYSKTYLIIPALLSLALAILSKKSGLIFLGIIPTALYFQAKIKTKFLIGFTGLILLTPIALKVLRKITKEGEALRIYTGIENPMFDASIDFNQISFSLHSLWFYFKKMLYTNELVAYYGYNTIPTTGYDITTVLTIIILIVLSFIAIKNLTKRTPVSFGIIVMFGGLIVFINLLIPMVGIVAERFATVATLGLCIFIPFGISELFSRFKIVSKSQLIGSSLIIGYCIISFTTIQARNKEWKNDETLFKADVVKEPNSATIQGLLGKIYLKKIPFLPSDQAKISMGKITLQHLEKSVNIAEDKYILTELGSLQFRAFLNYKEATKSYYRAIAHDSLFADPYYHLGWVYLAQKDTIRAIDFFKDAIQLKPSFINAYEPLLQLLVYTNRGSEAVAINQKGLNKYPTDLPLILNQANIHFVLKDYKNALIWYEKYQILNPNNKMVSQKINEVKSLLNKR
jgi:hypothetical protein